MHSETSVQRYRISNTCSTQRVSSQWQATEPDINDPLMSFSVDGEAVVPINKQLHLFHPLAIHVFCCFYWQQVSCL